MPQDVPQPTSTYERNLALRVEKERLERGWSYEQLAQRMAAVGCEIPPNAISRIQAERPRKISVNEFYAFAAVFGLEPQRMVEPISEDDDVRAKVAQFATAASEAAEPVERLASIYFALRARSDFEQIRPLLQGSWPLEMLEAFGATTGSPGKWPALAGMKAVFNNK